MKTLIVKTQAEWDALPEKFDEETAVHVYSDPNAWIVIKRNPENSSAVLWANSSAVLWANSRAVLRENSSAVLWANSSAVLWANSRAVLRENSRAVLRENSSAVLWANSRAEASHNSVVIIRDKGPKVKKSGNAQIVYTETFLHSIETFTEIYKPKRGKLILLKSVRPDTLTDHYPGRSDMKEPSNVLTGTRIVTSSAATVCTCRLRSRISSDG